MFPLASRSSQQFGIFRDPHDTLPYAGKQKGTDGSDVSSRPAYHQRCFFMAGKMKKAAVFYKRRP